MHTEFKIYLELNIVHYVMTDIETTRALGHNYAHRLLAENRILPDKITLVYSCDDYQNPYNKDFDVKSYIAQIKAMNWNIK